ncbi:MAG: type II toxin-antitoxin system mRNA interferase toxin, RelE/StbE family [Bacteroidetes bacterium]|nr:type II toxin-antitoxin system mRNA interferase toxin, RelE/StbE family [Bacteroidota bacterium]
MKVRKLVFSNSFNKSFKRFTKGNEKLKKSIINSIEILVTDPNSVKLSTHSLTGKLIGYFACSCGYDCRIIFTIEKNKDTKEEFILLMDIGTHDDVY